MRRFAVVLSLVLVSNLAFALPSAEQRVWFNSLSEDEAEAVRQAYKDQQLMKRWDSVTEVAVTELYRSPDMKYPKPENAIGWSTPVSRGEKVKVNWAFTMPRKASTPFDTEIRWFCDGKEIRKMTYGIDRPSPHYRLWDVQTMRRTGTWTIQITMGGRVLAESRFSVD